MKRFQTLQMKHTKKLMARRKWPKKRTTERQLEQTAITAMFPSPFPGAQWRPTGPMPMFHAAANPVHCRDKWDGETESEHKKRMDIWPKPRNSYDEGRWPQETLFDYTKRLIKWKTLYQSFDVADEMLMEQLYKHHVKRRFFRDQCRDWANNGSWI
jgi:hypothetical protein